MERNKRTQRKTGKGKRFSLLSELDLIHLVNDGNQGAKEELLKRMIHRIMKEECNVDRGP